MSFRFLDLPVELRLMVYDYLQPSVKHTVVSRDCMPHVQVIVITRHVPTAILSTCRTVHMEANKMFQDMIKTHTLNAPPRMIKNKFGEPLVQTLIKEIGDEAQAFLALPDGAGYYLEDTRQRIGRSRYSTIDELQMANVYRFIHQAVRTCTNNTAGIMDWDQPVELVDSVGRDQGQGLFHTGLASEEKTWLYDPTEAPPLQDVGFLDQDDELVFDKAVVPALWYLQPNPIRLPAMSVAEWVEGWLAS